MGSESKFSTYVNTTVKVDEIKQSGAADLAKQASKEREIQRIDKETKRETEKIDADLTRQIEEIQNSPVNIELIKKQELANFETAKKEHKRQAAQLVQTAENDVADAEVRLKQAERFVELAKKNLELTKEKSAEFEQASNLRAEQEYELMISSLGNTAQTIKLKIDKARSDAEYKKKQLEATGEAKKARLEDDLGEIKARNDALKERMEIWKEANQTLKTCIEKLSEKED